MKPPTFGDHGLPHPTPHPPRPERNTMGFSTECIHPGQEPEPVTGAVTYPIFQTSTYVQPELGKHKGFEYARTKNPTRSVLEANLAALERGKYAHCFASGMAATDTVFRMLKSGDHVVAGQIGFLQNAVGAILSPMDSWLILRGVKTLAVRMQQHELNGRAMADYLSRQPKALKTYYPGLPDHPQHELAKRQMRGFGAMISFELGSLANAKKFLDRVRLCSLGESLGGVETLISHPESMTHASVPLETRTRLGITPGLVRISVGIEDIADLIADVDQAFAAV